MIGTLDSQVIEKFREFQNKTEKYSDLDIEDIQFENISLSNDLYFEFIKGKNKYIQKYITKHPGEYAILGSSLKNECISNYIQPIDIRDVIDKPCVSFNKDNAKGSMPFYRDYPFLMDRHHIAILSSDNIFPQYLYYSLITYFEKSKFGWGENVASVEEVSKYSVPVPTDLNKKYSSINIQKIIVEFLEYSFNNLEQIKKNIDKRYDIVTKMQKSLVPSTFKRIAIKNRFKKYAEEKNIDFEITDIEFNIEDFDLYVSLKKGKSKYTAKYINQNKGSYPLYSSGTDNETKGLMGKINTFDYDTESIQFTANGEKAGTIFKLHKHKFSMNGDRGMFVPKNDKIELSFLYYNLKNEFMKHDFSWANKPTNTKIIEKIKIYIPKNIKNYDSLHIQRILANFIETVENELESKHLNNIKKCLEVITKYKETYLKRMFLSMNWSK